MNEETSQEPGTKTLDDEQEPQQEEEPKKERHTSEDETKRPEVKCPSCGWQGTSNELHSKTGLKFDVEFIFCPDCGEEVGDYEEDTNVKWLDDYPEYRVGLEAPGEKGEE